MRVRLRKAACPNKIIGHLHSSDLLRGRLEDLLNKRDGEEEEVVVEKEKYKEGEEAAKSVTKRTARASEFTLPALLLRTGSSSLCTLYGHDRFKQTLVLCIRKKRCG
jgi:hypothetical protein